MELPVFELKPLKKAFTLIMCLNVMLIGLGLVLPQLADFSPFRKYAVGSTGRILLFILLILSIALSFKWKKELNTILSIESFDERINRCQTFCIKRLWTNFVSLAFTFILVILTNGKFMFYYFLFQSILSLLGYPNKKFIAKELNDDQIIFA